MTTADKSVETSEAKASSQAQTQSSTETKSGATGSAEEQVDVTEESKLAD